MTNSVKKLDFLALMPCSLKVPLEQTISGEIQKSFGDSAFNYRIVSNAVRQEVVFSDISEAEKLDDLPDIVLAPGFSRFFYPDFIHKFRDKGCFKSVIDYPPTQVFDALSIPDPQGFYDIVGFNPLVFLVDKTKYPDLPTPNCWSDLLEPCYEGLVSYRGHNDKAFCEGVLLTVFKDFGYPGIRKLAKSVKSRLHPAEMVKYAGSRFEDAPAVSVIPLSFSRLVKRSDKVSVIWPEDGAVVNPLVMLVKKDAPDKTRAFGRYLAGSEIGSIIQEAGFYSVYPDLDTAGMVEGAYKWVGWDFLFSNNLSELVRELNEIMYDTIHAGK